MADPRENLPPIEFEMETLTNESVAAFAKATQSQYFKTLPPSYCTRFRKAEFEWLDRMKVDMRTLLHIEQEYEYLLPFQVGDKVHVSSKIAQWKERRGMTFVTIETNISASQTIKVKSSTTFLLQTGQSK